MMGRNSYSELIILSGGYHVGLMNEKPVDPLTVITTNDC